MKRELHVTRICSLCATGLLVMLAGCAQLEAMAPKAWEKDRLARKEMTIEGDAHAARLEQRVYSARENAAGGYGVGGGGCGCN